MPDERGLPTEDEIAELPRQACAAFAARCARRALPAFKESWPDAPSRYLRALERAVEVVERWASHRSSFDADFARAVLDDVTDIAHESWHHPAAYSAAQAAQLAASVVPSGTSAFLASQCAGCVPSAAAGLIDARVIGTPDAARRQDAAAFCAIRAVSRDFALLRTLAEQASWTDDTPVDVAVLGPLWPDGPPEGWPEDERSVPKPFALAIDPGDADKETIQEVMAALSELHEVHTGYALTYRIEGALIHAEAEVCA